MGCSCTIFTGLELLNPHLAGAAQPSLGWSCSIFTGLELLNLDCAGVAQSSPGWSSSILTELDMHNPHWAGAAQSSLGWNYSIFTGLEQLNLQILALTEFKSVLTALWAKNYFQTCTRFPTDERCKGSDDLHSQFPPVQNLLPCTSSLIGLIPFTIH